MASVTLHDTIRLHPDVVWREIDGEVVLLNVVTGLYYGLDPVGARIWRQVADAPVPLQVICDGLAAEYEGDAATIARDLLELAGRLADTQLVVIST